MDLDIRGGFTVFQLMTILEEAHHSLIFIEHDPLLYEGARKMTEYVSQAMREAANEAAILLYAPGADPYLEKPIKNADHVFYFDEEPRAEMKMLQKLICERRGARPRRALNRETYMALGHP